VRFIVHDFAGHPGQVQLSRELARRGHEVEHQFCASVTTGTGVMACCDGDPETFTVRAMKLRMQFARYSPMVRLRQELRYAWMSVRAITPARPDVAIFANVPLLALFLITVALRMRGIPYVFWWQDVQSDAIRTIARHRYGFLGRLAGWLAGRVERHVARGSAAIVPITEKFIDQLDAWEIERDKVQVIPNWGVVDEIPTRPRDNAWAKSHGLARGPVAMYAGTLGLKHDPAVLVELAKTAPTGTRLVVVSEGKGRDWLEAHAGAESRFTLLDYQPYEQLPDMLGSADVLVALLERDASRYSVPSKVLSYFCAGRAVLAVLPPDNAVAQMIQSAGAGLVVPPGDPAAASSALNRLLSDCDLREKMGMAARQYAERNFEIGVVGDWFESVIRDVYGRRVNLKRHYRDGAYCDNRVGISAAGIGRDVNVQRTK
jgi:glycosyltransferase involved in cell wall biosynthesis